jgi:excisionase family DNA binding protein
MPDDSPHDLQIDEPSYWITHLAELWTLMAASGSTSIAPGDASFATTETPLLVVDPTYWATNVDALIELLVDPLNEGSLIPWVDLPGLHPRLRPEDPAPDEESQDSLETEGTSLYQAVKRIENLGSESLAERLTLTVEEAAQTLGISRAFAYEAVRRREIPSIRIGRRVLVPRAALERMLTGEEPSSPNHES